MNISETDICNAALRLIRARPIGNLDDNEPNAAQCRFFYSIIRSVVFRSHPWKCIAKQATLETATTAPQFGFSYAYPLPGDYVRMIGMDDPQEGYRVYGGKVIHTDAAPAYIDYVPLELDTTKYSAELVRCLYLNLAYELAFGITGDAKIAETIRLDLEKFFLPIARMTDSVERGARTFVADTFTELFE